MNRLRFAVAVAGALFAAAPSAQAQIRRSTGTIPTTSIPSGTSVPAGMCRIWINGLPADRQPAPTDCTTAQRTVPPNGRVIYGGQTQGRNYPTGTTRGGQYDPRLDPRSSQYDPRLDPRNRNGTYGTNSRDDREQWERQRERDRQKQWKKQQKQNRKDDKHDDHDDNRGQHGQNGQHGHNDH